MSEHKIVLNRARCKRCGTEPVSTHRHHLASCQCGGIFVDGGRDYLRRGAEDLDLLEDTSIITKTYERRVLRAAGGRPRRGLQVEAYEAGIVILTTGPDGTEGRAEVGDYVVYEPEGGATAWTAKALFDNHVLVDE